MSTTQLPPEKDAVKSSKSSSSSKQSSDEKAIAGMGAIVHPNGVAFRVWAPNADRVAVMGTFNQWQPDQHPMRSEGNGYWYLNIDQAKPGDEYKYRIVNGNQELDRIDPYAKEVTNSVGNAIVYEDRFNWQDDRFVPPTHDELVIYELHIGTFHRTQEDHPGTFAAAIEKLPHLEKLGVNAIQIMPVGEFAGDWSWGYNPAHPFAVEQAYGGPDELKRLIKAAHGHGLAVIIDVVYNHFGPSDLDLWQFDGWSENGKGGIYFYNDDRSSTPWGETRPDYGRGEVRQYIYDNAMMWMREFHADGLRYDMTAYIRTISGIGNDDIAEGWGLMQWINRDIRSEFPNCILVAEDLQKNNWLTKGPDHGGAGFTTQWDAGFVHPIRQVVQEMDDAHRDMWAVRDALCNRYNGDAFQRVIYSESHDEVANGKARVPTEIDSEDAEGRFAQKRTVLAAAMALTAPGIPMLFQGQEMLEDDWFDDGDPLQWDRVKRFKGINRLFKDLINLRLNRGGKTGGLKGQFIDMHHVNEADKLVAFVRRDDDPQNDVVVVANFANRSWASYEIGFPDSGPWRLRFNSDWTGYSDEFDDFPVENVDAIDQARDGLKSSSGVSIGPYAVLIYSKETSED
ncbi:alpha amylase C-terminal domain-containing protein [Stieleria sp. JC731]|uniref:alpha-amylase family glycosyl hydrolase n=1 Tax=Pirellulaceae TaxID=2691357 RepID=UPI001E52C653|nr:alpha-amylase family glycosyl hydrolase [Stieleria sp. JC731]MCC9602976.1 alpha amylase C-terminal domain-containing protein [Stieleria sp. JC731]